MSLSVHLNKGVLSSKQKNVLFNEEREFWTKARTLGHVVLNSLEPRMHEKGSLIVDWELVGHKNPEVFLGRGLKAFKTQLPRVVSHEGLVAVFSGGLLCHLVHNVKLTLPTEEHRLAAVYGMHLAATGSRHQEVALNREREALIALGWADLDDTSLPVSTWTTVVWTKVDCPNQSESCCVDVWSEPENKSGGMFRIETIRLPIAIPVSARKDHRTLKVAIPFP